MKIQIRTGVFETNSSSTHSLVMCSEDEYNKWANGELYYCSWFPSKAKSLEKKGCDFYTEEEAKAICAAADIDWDAEDEDDYCERREHFETLDEFCDDEYLETEEYNYTTPRGEKVKAVAKYGYSG